MKIKVCGISDLKQLGELNSLKIDYAGFIFYKQSPRSVLGKLTGKEVKELSLSIEKVGVFVNATEEEIMDQIDLFGLDLVQLHGDETASFCDRISQHVRVIKAFRIVDFDTNIDWLVKDYDEVCDYYLFDKASASFILIPPLRKKGFPILDLLRISQLNFSPVPPYRPAEPLSNK
jgi:phosphoribosylanthranilate isomerase